MASDRCDLLCLDLEKAKALREHRLDRSAAEQAAVQAKALGDPDGKMVSYSLTDRGRILLEAVLGERVAA